MTARGWLMVVLIDTVVSLSGIGLYHGLTAGRRLKLASVDLAQVYREKERQFSAIVGKAGATEADRRKAVAMAQAFAKSLPSALAELSGQCGCVIVLGSAVAAGNGRVPDLTPALRAKVGL